MKSLVSLFILLSLACQYPAPGIPATPTSAADATFKVTVSVDIDARLVGLTEHESQRWSGTAWVVKAEDDVSYLVTAGHVCADSFNTEVLGFYLPQSAEYQLTDRSGAVHKAEKFAKSGKYDLCVLRSYDWLNAPALAIASEDPIYDEMVAYVGAPDGVYGCGDEGCGLAPMFRGHYAGSDLVSIPTAPGASGSGVFTSGGVIGVLVRVRRAFNNLTYIEPRTHIIDFLLEEGVL